MSKTPQSTLDILNYTFHLTSPRYVEGFKDFYHDLFQYKTRISAIKEDLSKFLLIMENDIYSNQIKEVHQAINISRSIQLLLEELEQLRNYTDNPTGYFKNVRVYGALKRGQSKIRKLRRLLPRLHLIVGIVIDKYPNSYGNKVKILLEKYKFIRIISSDDYQTLLWFEKENIFNCKNFKLLEKYVFIYFSDNSINISELYQLIHRLKTVEFGVYFLNVRRFQKIFPDFEKRHYPLKDINIFFHTTLFDLCKLWLTILRFPSFGRKYLKIEDEGQFIGSEYSLFYYMENLDIELSIKKIYFRDYFNNFKKLANSNLFIEPKLFLFYMKDIGIIMDLELTELLVLFGIKGIYGGDDIDTLKEITQTLNKNPAFKNERDTAANLWHKTIGSSLKDIQHLYLFLQLYSNLGRDFFNNLIANKHILSSSDINDLIFQMSNKYADVTRITTEDIISQIGNDKNDRKVVVVIAPKYDWNLSIYNSYEQFRRIPTDRFETHYTRISSANQLAFIIKSIGSKRLIDILIIDGHANPNLIRFSYSKGGELTKEALQTKTFDGIHRYFSKNAICYLGGCSTAKGSEPIANHLTKKFGIRVIAAKKNTSSQISIGKKGEPIVESTSRQKNFKPA